ncbi:NUDIX hydrolase [Candidatus Saccharibacteria bacterium]|nr:NUDIX hydrolase [Candidatus Saccharibacteria bacterium]
MSERSPKTDIEKFLKQALFNTIESLPTYPGYPEIRLTADDPVVAPQLATGGITRLPEGPWDAGYKKLKQQLSDDERRLLAMQGYTFDVHGRPLHPWLAEMLSNPKVGVVTGTGEYWSMGPNRTADPIIIATEDQPYVFLVRRNDNGLWAFPGGFIDPGETADEAGRREAFEEGGITVGEPEAVLYDGVVADTRTTAYAWAETTALLYKVPRRMAPLIDPAEVSGAGWFPLSGIENTLHGSHGVLLREIHAYGIPE